MDRYFNQVNLEVRKMSVKKKAVSRMIAVISAVVLLITMFGASAPASYAAAKKPAKVKLTSVKATGLKITAKWKKAKNAKKYQIYMKTGTGSWKLKKTLKKLVISVTGKEGVTYSFKVRGINGKKKGSFSAIRKISIPKKEKPVDPQDPEDPDHEKTPLEIAADKVTDQILALPKPNEITDADSEAVAAARKAYTRLPESAKVFVKPETLEALEAAERRLTELPAEAALALIEKLPKPEKITENSMERVQEAVSAYNALTDEQKLLITDEAYEKLRLAMIKYQELLVRQENRKAANAVSKRIMNYWDTSLVTYSDKHDIENIRAAYEALSDEQKEFVDKQYTLPVLEAAEAVIAEKDAVIQSYMVKWPKVTVDSVEYYKVIEEDERVLLLLADRAVDADGNYVSMTYGETNSWRDSNVRQYMNGEYLDAHPQLKNMALDTEITTRILQTLEDVNSPRYDVTTDKMFALSSMDIDGGEASEAEFTNGSSMLAGLEKEEYVKGRITWYLQDFILPPTDGRDGGDNSCWTRTPALFYFSENGPLYQQDNGYSTTYFENDDYWPYKRTDVSRSPLEYEYGVQPACWVDREKLAEVENAQD